MNIVEIWRNQGELKGWQVWSGNTFHYLKLHPFCVTILDERQL